MHIRKEPATLSPGFSEEMIALHAKYAGKKLLLTYAKKVTPQNRTKPKEHVNNAIFVTVKSVSIRQAKVKGVITGLTIFIEFTDKQLFYGYYVKKMHIAPLENHACLVLTEKGWFNIDSNQTVTVEILD